MGSWRWHLQSGLIPAFRAIIAVVSQRSGLTAKTPSLDSKTRKGGALVYMRRHRAAFRQLGQVPSLVADVGASQFAEMRGLAIAAMRSEMGGVQPWQGRKRHGPGCLH